MWDNFIGRQIRRANRNLLIVNVIILLIVGGVVAGNWKYLTNWFRGPAPMRLHTAILLCAAVAVPALAQITDPVKTASGPLAGVRRPAMLAPLLAPAPPRRSDRARHRT